MRDNNATGKTIFDRKPRRNHQFFIHTPINVNEAGKIYYGMSNGGNTKPIPRTPIQN